jgi:hypothetical protein
MEYKYLKIKRREIPGRDLWVVDFVDFLRIVDAWSQGHILDHIGVQKMGVIYGVTCPETVAGISKFIAENIPVERMNELIGTAIILGSAESYTNYIYMCPDNTQDHIRNVTLKYVNENFNYVDREFVRK